VKTSIVTEWGTLISLWRSLLPADAFHVVDPPPGIRVVRPWWGEGLVFELGEGDQLIVFASPYGLQVDGVQRKHEPS